jgi:hypothetical protein
MNERLLVAVVHSEDTVPLPATSGRWTVSRKGPKSRYPTFKLTHHRHPRSAWLHVSAVAPCVRFGLASNSHVKRGRSMRIALIHALKHSVVPIEQAFARLWPEAVLANLLDDSLSSDLAREGALTAAMTERFLTLARYAAACGADGILFTCSAFGPCIDACAQALAPMPVLKPNEAMIDEAVALAGSAGRIGLLATFAPSLATLPAEFVAAAPGVTLQPALAAGALAALDRGDPAEHDRLAAETARSLEGCDVVALAQFSLASAAPLVAQATGRPVLTTPDSAVRKLRRLLAA